MNITLVMKVKMKNNNFIIYLYFKINYIFLNHIKKNEKQQGDWGLKDNCLALGKSFSKNRKCYFFNTSDSNINNNEIESYRKKNLNYIYSNKNILCNTINNVNKYNSNSISKINNTDPSNSIRKNKSHFYVNSQLDKYKIKGKIIYIDLTNKNKINNIIKITKNEEDNKYKNID